MAPQIWWLPWASPLPLKKQCSISGKGITLLFPSLLGESYLLFESVKLRKMNFLKQTQDFWKVPSPSLDPHFWGCSVAISKSSLSWLTRHHANLPVPPACLTSAQWTLGWFSRVRSSKALLPCSGVSCQAMAEGNLRRRNRKHSQGSNFPDKHLSPVLPASPHPLLIPLWPRLDSNSLTSIALASTPSPGSRFPALLGLAGYN